MSFPRTLALHLSKTVLIRILAVILMLGGLAAALDLAENASDLLRREDGGLWRYLGLRAPLILAAVAPVGLIVGPVLAFLTLSSRSEFTIMRASGATTYFMLAALIPLALLIGAGLFALNDRIAPKMEGRLITWLDDGPKAGAGDFWARTTTSVVRADASNAAGDLITGAQIYETDPQGRLLSRVDAEAMRHEDGVWRFEAARRLIPGEGRSTDISGQV